MSLPIFGIIGEEEGGKRQLCHNNVLLLLEKMFELAVTVLNNVWLLFAVIT